MTQWEREFWRQAADPRIHPLEIPAVILVVVVCLIILRIL